MTSHVQSRQLAIPVLDPQAARTILVVDDCAINRNLLVSLLQYFYRVVEADSAEEAYAIATRGHLDLIVTDLHMNGMDGFALLDKLAVDPATAGIPAILYTAIYKTPAGDAPDARLGQVHAVLSKPSSPQDILKTIQSALNAPHPDEAALVPGPVQEAHSIGGFRASALIEIMLDLAEKIDPADRMRCCCNAAKALLEARQTYAWLLPGGDGSAASAFGSKPGNPGVGFLVQKGGGSNLPAIISTHLVAQYSDADPAEFGLPESIGRLSSLLCVPIFTRNRDYGCLLVIDRIDGAAFSLEDERLATTLTAQVAILQENGFINESVARAELLTEKMEARRMVDEERERSRKEEIRLKDQFLSHVSHELRSPVMAVQQFLEIVQEGIAGEINEQQHEYLGIALRNTRQLNGMISDLLEATRIEVGKLRIELRSMTLTDVLTEAVNSAMPTASDRHIEIGFAATDLPAVIADRGRIRQILTNLLDNAIKFTPSFGSIKVHAGIDPLRPGFVTIEVTDTGYGVSPKDIARVFDLHYQVSERDASARKGLGLGLSICKELVTLHRGIIELESELGVGSTFRFTLPIFSEHDLLMRTVKYNGAVAEEVAILAIELAHPHAFEAEDVWTSLRATIDGCLRARCDVVMPDCYTTPRGRMFLVIAQAGEQGGGALASRLEEALSSGHCVADLPSPPQLSVQVINLPSSEEIPEIDEQADTAIARIVEGIHAAIKR